MKNPDITNISPCGSAPLRAKQPSATGVASYRGH